VRLRAFGIVVLLCCFATVGFAADRVIENGIDAWRTTEDGSTFYSFEKTPIPAGFFCPGSAPFTGRIAFRGEPLATDTPGALGATDTIVQRLDDAPFNKNGVAVTRLQFRALSLKSLAPIETACGKFDATVRLDGVQPITRMVITRENKHGGRFSAPLALNVKISFKPVGRPGLELLEIPAEIRFPADPKFPWRSKLVAPEPSGFVRVDTDGDNVPDTYVPGTSNFFAGHSPRSSVAKPGGGQYYCHDSGDEDQHCFFLCNGCQIP
jgi:hypothetical protein